MLRQVHLLGIRKKATVVLANIIFPNPTISMRKLGV